MIVAIASKYKNHVRMNNITIKQCDDVEDFPLPDADEISKLVGTLQIGHLSIDTKKEFRETYAYFAFKISDKEVEYILHYMLVYVRDFQ